LISNALMIASAVCLLFSIVPLLPVPHGAVRSFDFARLQVISLSLIVLAGTIIFWSSAIPIRISLALAGSALAIQLVHVVPFTPIWRRQTARHEGNPDAVTTISLLVCNVKQSNRDFDSVTRVIERRRPDIVILMETDAAWATALEPTLSDFRETVRYPQPNTYGMILASRFALAESAVQFLLNEEVPSIWCRVTLPDGNEVRVIALHPEPPIPSRDTLGRDAEILLVGKKAREEYLPTIVTGDLNDVAWSRTTRRFLRISRLLDPRQGRGLFNSFHAQFWFLRWPLDHIFHSRHFELVSIERLPSVGSDHFPMYYRFALTDEARNTPPSPASKDDIEEADEAVKAEKARDRPPVGTDWEKT